MDNPHDGTDFLRTPKLRAMILFAQVLGYQRALQATDLWKVAPEQEASYLSDKLEAAWSKRVNAAEKWNAGLDDGTVNPPILVRFSWSLKALSRGREYHARRAALEKRWRQVDARRQASLAWSLNDVLGPFFWLGGASKVRFTLHFH